MAIYDDFTPDSLYCVQGLFKNPTDNPLNLPILQFLRHCGFTSVLFVEY